MRPVYLMHSTTAPLDPRVREVMIPLLDEDPRRGSSLLGDARRIARLIEESRARVAAMAGSKPGEIVFTGGGTEACNLALKGVALSRLSGGGRPGRILVAASERTAVLYPARTMARLGYEVREVPVDRHGVVALDALTDMLGANTHLVSVALATAETGALQPLAEIARIVHERGALLHTDACLAAAYQPMDVKALDVDLASFSAHLLRGPRGVGALYVREGVRLQPLVEGGVNEGGRRGGAENVAGIAGFAQAARLAAAELEADAPRMAGLGAMMQEALAGSPGTAGTPGAPGLPGVTLNGHPDRRLRALVNLSASGVDGEALLMKLARKGVAASSGSSCYQTTGKPSHVLLAMGVPPALAQGSVLLAAGRDTTAEEARRVIGIFPEALESLRAIGLERP